LLAPGEDKPQPDKPAANTTPLMTANAEATAAAGDEIIIGERRLISERRVAAMLGYSQRQLQRWRKEQKGPASTKIGRRLFYELDTLQEWIEEKKQVMPAVRIWLTKLPRINRPTSISRGVLADPRLTRSSSPTTTRSDRDPCLQTKIVGFKDDSESSAVWTDLIEMKPRASATLTVILSIRCFGGAARRAESNEPQHRPGRSTGSCRRLVEAPGYR
jgi:predicted DNA-binding transcriptional regulator AlpA